MMRAIATSRQKEAAIFAGDWETELGKLEACLATLGANLATPYDEAFIAQKRKALLEQGISLLTIEMEPQEVKIH